MPTWTLTPQELPLRYVWKISRNTSTSKTNLFIKLEGKGYVGAGEAAPNIRYNETPELLQQQFEALQSAGLSAVDSLEQLDALLATIPVAPALTFGLESALSHWLAARASVPVWQWLGVPPPAPAVSSAFTLPIMEPEEVAGFLQAQDAFRFNMLKIKVNAAGGLELLREVARVLPNHAMLVDGNEAWPDADSLMVFLEQAGELPGLYLRLLEQPLPAHCVDDYRYLRTRTPVPLIADESVTDSADFSELTRQFHGVNVKLMKAGGYRRGIDLLRRTKAHGLMPMIGCMVETTLGISSAMQISALAKVHDLDGFLILKDEPYKLVTEKNGLLTMSKEFQ